MEPWKRYKAAMKEAEEEIGFNGATAMEPWKRPSDAFSWDRSSKLQWGHGDGAVEEQGRGDRPAPPDLASMGPRRWSRGRVFLLTVADPGRMSFNGATAMEPWKRPRAGDEGHRSMKLQWGHGDGAVEEFRKQGLGRKKAKLQWGHGDGAVEESSVSWGSTPGGWLQWGHGDGAVEEADWNAIGRWYAKLQWGHGDGAVEEAGAYFALSRRSSCFNGATAMEPWKSVTMATPKRKPKRFNGATAMEPWKR